MLLFLNILMFALYLFAGMKVYTTDEKELIMEASLKWAGNPNFTIAVKAFGLRLTVQVFALHFRIPLFSIG